MHFSAHDGWWRRHLKKAERNAKRASQTAGDAGAGAPRAGSPAVSPSRPDGVARAMAGWESAWDARLAAQSQTPAAAEDPTGGANDDDDTAGVHRDVAAAAASSQWYAVRGARVDEVVEVSSSDPALIGGDEQRRGPFASRAEAEAALAEMMLGDFEDAFADASDPCPAGASTAAGVGPATATSMSAASAPVPVQRLSVSVEAASRRTFHVQAVGNDLHCTAKLHSLLAKCPETQLSAATVDGHPTFDLASRDAVVYWLRAHGGVAQVDDIPGETARALECYNRRWEAIPEQQVDARLKQMASFAPRLAKLLLPYQSTGVTTAIRFDGRMLLADDMGEFMQLPMAAACSPSYLPLAARAHTQRLRGVSAWSDHVRVVAPGLGKTYQALAAAACYSDEWQIGTPLLLVLPCSLRRQWAEELESKFPQLSPTEIHTVKTTTGGNEEFPSARVVLISYRLLALMGEAFCKRR
jgi:hypothetical protein